MRRFVASLLVLSLSVLNGCGGGDVSKPATAEPAAAKRNNLQIVQGADSPAAQGDSSSAQQIAVLAAIPRPLMKFGESPDWLQIPDFLKGAEIQKAPLERQSTSMGLKLRVERGGLMLVALPFPEQPQAYDQGRMQLEEGRTKLIEQNWQPISLILLKERNELLPHVVFRRVVKTGEDVGLLVPPPYQVPYLICLQPEHAAKIADLPMEELPQNLVFSSPGGLADSLNAEGLVARTNQAVCLTLTDPPAARDIAPGLTRELIRQAILIAARDEMGLPTRDQALREEFPSEPDGKHAPLDVLLGHTFLKQILRVTLLHRDSETRKVLWQKQLTIPAPYSIEQLTTTCDDLSRTVFPELLQQTGWTARPRPQKTPVTLPSDLEDRLMLFNPITQFGIVREMHDLLRTHGEHPEILIALSRAYSNLASTTEYLWSPCCRAFQARALLYAERVVRNDPQDVRGYWNRAYVRGLIGRHAGALEDLELAATIHAFQQAQGRTDLETPRWLQPIRDFCECRYSALEETETDPQVGVLAAYLQMLSWPFVQPDKREWKVAQRLLERSPDCLRCYYHLLHSGPLGMGHMVRQTVLGQASQSVARQLARMPGAPDELLQTCKKYSRKDSNAAVAQILGCKGALIPRLRDKATRQNEIQEPSSDALASLVQEIAFHSVFCRLYFERFSWGIPTTETVDKLEPLVAQHPYVLYLNSYRGHAGDGRQAAEKLLSQIKIAEIDKQSFDLVRWLLQDASDLPMSTQVREAAHYRLDSLYSDLGGVVMLANADFHPESQIYELESVSPYSSIPAVGRCLITTRELPKDAEKWEARFHDDPHLLMVLGNLYYQHQKWADAERCLERVVEQIAAFNAYRMLAVVYEAQGNHEAWQEALELALQEESFGLEHAQVRIDLAYGFMNRDQWEQALPHALGAAGTGSSLGFRCAADCYEGMQSWAEAEAILRADAERYESASLNYYFWCRRTGKGDREIAQGLAQQYIDVLAKPLPADGVWTSSSFLALTGHPQDAIATCRDAMARDPEMRTAELLIYAALLADSLKDAETRDKLLAETEQLNRVEFPDKPQMKCARKLSRILRGVLAGGSLDQLSLPAIDELLADSLYSERTFVSYLAGRFLWDHGDRQDAETLLHRAATSSNDCTARTMAAAFLHDQNKPVGALRHEE